MSGVNKVILIGNVGNDPEVKYLSSGTALANISVATSESWKDKDTGEKKEKTEWHRVTFFGPLADIVAQYVHKGSKLYIEGRLETRKWQDAEGNDRYTTEVKVDGFRGAMQMLDSKPGGDAANPPPQQQKQSAKRRPAKAAPAQPDLDDDIPF